MSFDIESKNEYGVLGKPNGFWNAMMVETPICKMLDTFYTERNTINYEHCGFMGDWFTEAEANEMYNILIEFVKTPEYLNHRYFSERKNQMDQFLEFLPKCGGFRKC